MSDTILTVEGGKIKEHEVPSDEEVSSEHLYNALSKFMGVPADKDPTNVIVTGIGAIEYACIVGKQTGVSKDAFIESVTNVWDRVANAGGGTVREQGQV
tara:strand:+ start:372 stop:668 length:297 start_codon:yes stop_codon:yes gene_type:complete